MIFTIFLVTLAAFAACFVAVFWPVLRQVLALGAFLVGVAFLIGHFANDWGLAVPVVLFTVATLLLCLDWGKIGREVL